MPGENEKKKVREGFHRELHKHIEMLRHEFDKIETTVIQTYRMENVNAEIRQLQNMKDIKIRMLRIQFHHEADIIVKEFKEKVQDILDRDGSESCDVGSGDDSNDDQDGNDDDQDGNDDDQDGNNDDQDGNNDDQDGNDDGQGKKKRKQKDKHGKGKKGNAKKTDTKRVSRRTGRQRTTKRATRHDGSSTPPGNVVEPTGHVANSEQFLTNRTNERHRDESKELTESSIETDENDEPKEPKVEERKVGKLILKRGKNGEAKVIRRGPDQDSANEADAPTEDDNEAGPSSETVEGNAEEGNSGEATPSEPVRRSGREGGKRLGPCKALVVLVLLVGNSLNISYQEMERRY